MLRAILHFVPWGADGLSLDLMRRDRTAQPGLNDFLIVETIKARRDLGVKRISLNFAVFRAALERGERIGAGPVLRAWRGILLFMSRWFQIESLYKFNAKFCPVWVPRFFVFPGTRDTPRVGAGRAGGRGVPGLAEAGGAQARPAARPGPGPPPPGWHGPAWCRSRAPAWCCSGSPAGCCSGGPAWCCSQWAGA